MKEKSADQKSPAPDQQPGANPNEAAPLTRGTGDGADSDTSAPRLTLKPLSADHPIFSQGVMVTGFCGVDFERLEARRAAIRKASSAKQAPSPRPVKSLLAKPALARLLRRADRLLGQERFAEALPFYLEAIAANSQSKQALFGAGVCSALTNEWELGYDFLVRAKAQGHPKAESMLRFCRRELCVPPGLRDRVHAIESEEGPPLLSPDLGQELKLLNKWGPLTQREINHLTPEGMGEYLERARVILHAVGETEFKRLRKELRARFLTHIYQNYQLPDDEKLKTPDA